MYLYIDFPLLVLLSGCEANSETSNYGIGRLWSANLIHSAADLYGSWNIFKKLLQVSQRVVPLPSQKSSLSEFICLGVSFY
jgi:hypothetical protein